MDEIVSVSAGALNAEHYQTFEMAKANDDVLGGTDLGLLKAYSEVMRAAVNSAQMTMKASKSLGVASGVKQETAQLQAKVALYADERIGELLSELPKASGNQYQSASPDVTGKATKGQAIKDAGISKGVAEDLQKLAAHPEVVEETIAKAEEEGKPVSRARALKDIKKKKETEVSSKAEHGKQDKKPRRKHEDIFTKDGKTVCNRCGGLIEPGDEDPGHRTFHKECWKKRHSEINQAWRDRQHLKQNITIGDVNEVIEHDKAELKRQLLLDVSSAWSNLQATITRYESMGVSVTEEDVSRIRDAINTLVVAITTIEEGESVEASHQADDD
jgi:hypothetical protein